MDLCEFLGKHIFLTKQLSAVSSAKSGVVGLLEGFSEIDSILIRDDNRGYANPSPKFKM